jgi:hypothetical protein
MNEALREILRRQKDHTRRLERLETKETPAVTEAPILFLYAVASTDIATYYQLVPTHSTAGTSTIVTAGLTNGALVAAFATEPGAPGLDFLSEGLYHVHVHAAKTAGTKVATLYAEIYARDTAATETLIATTEQSPALTGVALAYDVDIAASEVDLNVTDRIVVKIRAGVTGAGTAPEVTLSLEGATSARLEMPSTSAGGAGVQGAGNGVANRVALWQDANTITVYPVSSGTSFPASPFTGQEFFRTDLWLKCVYNGTFWHAVWPHWVLPEELNAQCLGNWPFTRYYSTTHYDLSQAGYNLTAAGTPTRGSLNDPRAAYYTLNGSSQYFLQASTIYGGWTTASACIWFYLSALGTQQMLMSEDNNVTRGWAFYVSAANKLSFSGTTATPGSSTLAQNTWYLGLFTYTGGNVSLYLYTTSTESAENAPTAITVGAYTAEFEVGRRNHTTPDYFNGRVAAPKFFLTALTAKQREYIALCEIALVKG